MLKTLFSLAMLICFFGGSLKAQSVNDEQDMQTFARRFMAAYNAQDHAAIGKMYADDAVRIDPNGKEIKGAANIAAYFAEQFRANNTTLLLRQTGIVWSDAQHAWMTKGSYEVYGKSYVYDIPIDLRGSYANTMQKSNGEWKIVRSVLSAPDMTKIKDEIQAIENEWAKAASNKDLATIVAFYADDAVSMNPNEPMRVGKAAIQKGIEAEFAKRPAGPVVAFETMDVYGDEHLATEIGKTTVKDATGKVIYTGKYMAVWEKRKGRWVTIRDISNDDKKE